MRVLITGASGQVGRELARSSPIGATVSAVDRHDLDVGDAAAVRALVEDFRPTLILNAAAYTGVDRAETDADVAMRVNGDGPRLLAEAARVLGDCRLIHISTDYVFDGRSPRAYTPDDEPRPICVYGHSKLAGERAVLRTAGIDAAIVRTSWVYAPHGRNFLQTMLRRMRERGEVRVVADQIGTPTAARSLAEALWVLAGRSGLAGLLHWTDAGVASWYDFAVAIAEEAAARGLLPGDIVVTPIATNEYPTPARRPACSLLDKRATIAALGMAPWHWRQRLRQVLGELTSG
jgi:dTDP-4-dehydrorhamnose reductase